MTDVLAKLHTDEQTFYAIANKAWNECSDNQKDFFNFNSTYTPDYIAGALKDVQAAKDLPNFDARQAVLGRMRTILEGKAVVCNGLVQNLYTIIARSFSPDQVDSMRQEAGSGYYRSAAGGNWNSADTLYGMVAQFLVTYNDDLLNGNMPVNFPDSFTDAQTDFDKAFTDYRAAKDNVSKGGVAKSGANTVVQAALVRMLADGKAIYRNEPAKRKYFNFDGLKKMVAGPGQTGIRFSLKQAVTELPVANAVITMQPGNYTLYPDKKGVVVEIVPANTYTYSITAPGAATVEGSIKVKAGGIRRANVVMAAEVVTPVAAKDDNSSALMGASEAS